MATGRDRPYYSGNHKCHGMNVQVIADPAGRLIWASPALPGARHDMGAVREHGTLDALHAAEVRVITDNGYRGAEPAFEIPQQRRRLDPDTGRYRPLSDNQRDVNATSTPRTPASPAPVNAQTPSSRPGRSSARSAAAPTAQPTRSRPSSSSSTPADIRLEMAQWHWYVQDGQSWVAATPPQAGGAPVVAEEPPDVPSTDRPAEPATVPAGPSRTTVGKMLVGVLVVGAVGWFLVGLGYAIVVSLQETFGLALGATIAGVVGLIGWGVRARGRNRYERGLRRDDLPMIDICEREHPLASSVGPWDNVRPRLKEDRVCRTTVSSESPGHLRSWSRRSRFGGRTGCGWPRSRSASYCRY
jgi:hypothetical protein